MVVGAAGPVTATLFIVWGGAGMTSGAAMTFGMASMAGVV
jgi:hypothetical protein